MSQQILNSYHDFVNYGGKDAFDHLVQVYVIGGDPENEHMLSSIPHPYRAYVEKGQKMVVDHIRAAAQLAEEKEPEPEVKEPPLKL